MPSVLAWMKYLGPKPTTEQFGTMYADWIHASPKGAYITAYCIHSALTGFSPLGLAYPVFLTPEARQLQELAREAFLETNPRVETLNEHHPSPE